MSKPNRGDFTDSLESMGIDASGSGLPLSDGLIPVLPFGDAIYQQQKTFGARMLVLPVAAQFCFINMVCQVPTRILRMSFEGITSGGAGDFAIIPAGAGPAGTLLTTPAQSWGSPRNLVATGTTAAVISSDMTVDEGETDDYNPNMNTIQGWLVAGGMRIILTAATINDISFFTLVWQEQVAVRVNPDPL